MEGSDSFECERKDSDDPADGEGIENAGQSWKPRYPCKTGFQKWRSLIWILERSYIYAKVNVAAGSVTDPSYRMFSEWIILKQTVVHQMYDIPRDIGISHVDTDVVTYVVQKPQS